MCNVIRLFSHQQWHVTVLMLVVFLASFIQSMTFGAEPNRTRRFIYNSDGGNIFIDKEPPMTPEDVYTYVDEVADTQITTYYICPNYGMPLIYSGQVTEMVGSLMEKVKRDQFMRDGYKPEKKGTLERGVANLDGLLKMGHDPIGLVVDRAREKGMEVFITFRLNEIHDVQNTDSLIVSRFWRQHPQWRVGTHGDQILPLFKEIIGGSPNHKVHPIVASWFPGAMNFAVPEVRDLRMAQLRECCERYAIDGIDLDFQRFPIYFPQDEGHKHVTTMTDWVHSVRAMTREVGSARGKPLLVSARILAKPEQNLAIGLDPVTWAQKGLVDFLVVSHYLRNDFPLPIADFRRQLPDTMPLYGSIEVESKRETYRDIASTLWQDGADGILMFNFFTGRENGKQPPFDLFHELGDPATIKANHPESYSRKDRKEVGRKQ